MNEYIEIGNFYIKYFDYCNQYFNENKDKNWEDTNLMEFLQWVGNLKIKLAEEIINENT